MSNHTQMICPFSKPIVSRWCQCPYTTQMQRCNGKMTCTRTSSLYPQCKNLIAILDDHSSFILGIKKQNRDLTHAHAMKIRCGGMLGMQRVLLPETTTPANIPNIIEAMNIQYGDAINFPFNQIINDIKNFSHRKKMAENS